MRENKNLFSIAKECVVGITNKMKYNPSILDPFEKTVDTSYGTGFFIDKKHVLTNHHVVKHGESIYINIHGQTEEIEMKVLWIQPKLDYAILVQKKQVYVPKKLFPIGDSSKLRCDDIIQVIGYPLNGYYENLKVLTGKVNGWESNKIQHDTDTNPGSSGSPLLHNGKIVGLHKEGHASSDIPGNIMFAASINSLKLKRVLKLKEHGYLHIPHFPFRYQNITKNMQEYFVKYLKLKPTFSGILITSSSSKFDLKAGDIVTKINNYTISCEAMVDFHSNKQCIMHFKHLATYLMGGDMVGVEYMSRTKNGSYKPKKTKIKMLGPQVGGKKKLNKKGGDTVVLRDLILQNITKEILQEMQVYENIEGVLVSHVYNYSKSEDDAIIVPGTIITAVNQQDVKSISDVKDILLRTNNEFILLHTIDNEIDVLKRSECLESIHKDFTQWKIPNDTFYTKLTKKWKQKKSTK